MMKDEAQNNLQNNFIDRAKLRTGWTTGACATAATKSALNALILGNFLDPVSITLPKGQQPSFRLAYKALNKNWAKAGIIKDGGDDPDVTSGALIIVKVSQNKNGEGVIFRAGKGVGTITKPGLPLAVGEPAINPSPRKMMCQLVKQICQKYNIDDNFIIEISVKDGEKIAKKTWNPRLGIRGGISILGTSGIVIPYSCSAWISTIHMGVDVALNTGQKYLVGATGDLSERAVKKQLDLAEEAFIDMGDFVGALLKYARAKPIEKIIIAGGFAKVSKLAKGALDLHSKRSRVDFLFLIEELKKLGASEKIIKQVKNANSANQILEISQKENIKLANLIAKKAQKQAQKIVTNNKIKIDIFIINQRGEKVAFTGEK